MDFICESNVIISVSLSFYAFPLTTSAQFLRDKITLVVFLAWENLRILDTFRIEKESVE